MSKFYMNVQLTQFNKNGVNITLDFNIKLKFKHENQVHLVYSNISFSF